jgi:hypothetical protein
LASQGKYQVLPFFIFQFFKNWFSKKIYFFLLQQ